MEMALRVSLEKDDEIIYKILSIMDKVQEAELSCKENEIVFCATGEVSDDIIELLHSPKKKSFQFRWKNEEGDRKIETVSNVQSTKGSIPEKENEPHSESYLETTMQMLATESRGDSEKMAILVVDWLKLPKAEGVTIKDAIVRLLNGNGLHVGKLLKDYKVKKKLSDRVKEIADSSIRENRKVYDFLSIVYKSFKDYKLSEQERERNLEIKRRMDEKNLESGLKSKLDCFPEIKTFEAFLGNLNIDNSKKQVIKEILTYMGLKSTPMGKEILEVSEGAIYSEPVKLKTILPITSIPEEKWEEVRKGFSEFLQDFMRKNGYNVSISIEAFLASMKKFLKSS